VVPRFLTVESRSITIDAKQLSAFPRAVAIAPDGKIVVAGAVRMPGGDDFAVARLNADLSPDVTFAGDGAQSTDFDGRDDVANGVVVQTLCGPAPRGRDHRITLVGGAVIAGALFTDEDLAEARFSEDGTLDTSFAGDGKWSHSNVGTEYANAVAAQPDGKLVLVGANYDGSDYDFKLARLTLGGGLDSSFDGDGRATTGFGGDEIAESVAIDQNNGTIPFGSWTEQRPLSEVPMGRFL